MVPRNDAHTVERFREFYRDEYHDHIEEFAQKYPTEQRSFYLDWTHVDQYDSELADDLISNPEQTLDCAAEALRMHGRVIDDELEDVRVRVKKIGEITPLSTLRSKHLGTLVEVVGRVTEVSPVTSALSEGAWECDQCGALTRTSHTPTRGTQTPNECNGCEQRGQFTLAHDQSEWVDHRSFRIERRTPDGPSVTAVVKELGASTDRVATGEQVRITGVLRREEVGEPNESSLPDKYIQPHAIVTGANAQVRNFSSAERGRMIELSKTSDIYERMIDSVAPSVYGHRQVKLAIVLQLFSGVSKDLPSGSQLSGGIHTLLVGDPGTAKSTFGDAARRLSPNGGLISGTGEQTFESEVTTTDFSAGLRTELSSNVDAGRATFADAEFLFIDDVHKLASETRGALIDDLAERTRDSDETGTVTGQSGRASVLCTAKPKHGRFDKYEPVGDQIDLDPQLLSQFDLIFVLSDCPGDDADRHRAEHVVKTHLAGELRTNRSTLSAPHVSQADVNDATPEVTPAIETDFLRKYIAFANHNCCPTMTEEAMQALCEFYLGLRERGKCEDAPVPVTAKKLGTLVRLAEASARVRLSDRVTTEDTDRATELLRFSLQEVGVNPETGELDVDIIEIGSSKTERDRLKDVQALVSELEEEHEQRAAPVETVVERAARFDTDSSKIEHYIEKLKSKGEVYEPFPGHLRTT